MFVEFIFEVLTECFGVCRRVFICSLLIMIVMAVLLACLLADWMMQIRLALETKNGSGSFSVLATRSILMALGPTVQH
jgi:hypothetical protein